MSAWAAVAAMVCELNALDHAERDARWATIAAVAADSSASKTRRCAATMLMVERERILLAQDSRHG